MPKLWLEWMRRHFLIEPREWRQICFALCIGTIGIDQRQEPIIYLSTVLGILKTHAVPGCDFVRNDTGFECKWPKEAT